VEEAVVVVKNMQDQKDADKVLHALLDVWGIGRAEIDLQRNQATFTYDTRMASLHDFERALLDTGYEVASGTIEQ
jgi:copper chaperone CopZ